MSFNAPAVTAARLRGGSILIIADDLTGAADSAVPFRQAGFSAIVLAGPPASHAARPRAQVTSISLNSRSLSPAAVRRLWARHAPMLKGLAQGAVVYQKIDSTLRGHAALEVRLLLDILGASAALIAPAFPKLGRCTLDGVHRVDGVPLAGTEYARTQRRAVASSDLRELFTTADDRPPVHLPLKAVEQGAAYLTGRLEDYLKRPRQLITADATEERHLDVLAEAALPLAGRVLLVGSAGWAERLAIACQGRLASPGRQPGVLAVVGSLSAVATRQAQVASGRGVHTVRFQLPTAADSQGDGVHDLPAVIQALTGGRHALLWTRAGARQPSPSRAGQGALEELAAAVREILAATPVSGLAVVGGETARTVCRALRASGLVLAGEVLPGLPYGRLLDGPFAGLAVATKAGGFGGDTALHECLQFLQRWGCP